MKTAITELIKTARWQAERLRRDVKRHTADTDYLDHVLMLAEADLWQQLADSAEQETAGLIVPLPPAVGGDEQ